jgi:hypothetical protein
VWKCAGCRHQFSVLTGTALHATKVPVSVWVAVADEWTAAGGAPSVSELMQRHRISRDAARRIHRVLTTAGPPGPVGLATLLAISGRPATQLRETSAVRRRPRPQHGPSAEYGG